jgi:FMNH2-dependent dimethyl sulfone monooxygenase
LDVLNGVWSQSSFSYAGKYYSVENTVLEPKPVRKPRPPLYAGGESEAAKNLIAQKCDAYVMHGDSPQFVATKIADMRERRERFGLPPMQYGVAGYAIVRDTEADAKRELERITDVNQNASGFANYQQWLSGTQLEQRMSIEEYSVSNRGLRTGLVGTPNQVQDRLGAFEAAGVDRMLLQFSPQLEEMERFGESVISALVPA